MNLADTILFIEAREAGNRSAGVLSSGNLASNQINKPSVHTEQQKTASHGYLQVRAIH